MHVSGNKSQILQLQFLVFVCNTLVTLLQLLVSSFVSKHFWYFLDNELYYTGGKEGIRRKVVLTIEEIGEILHHHHSKAMGGHSGVNATLNKISNYYCWNGMKEDVQEYVSL